MNQSDQTTQPDSIEDVTESQVEAHPPVVDKETRAGKFLKTATRWLFGLLIVFGLGALAVIFGLYNPIRETLNQTQADLNAANQKIAELENQVQALTPLKAQNMALQKEVDAANTHIKILTILAEVETARVALAHNDAAAAKIALTNTPAALKEMAVLAGSSQAEAIKIIQDRLDIVMGEIENDAATAQTDLEVMATKLLELEQALFGQ